MKEHSHYSLGVVHAREQLGCSPNGLNEVQTMKSPNKMKEHSHYSLGVVHAREQLGCSPNGLNEVQTMKSPDKVRGCTAALTECPYFSQKSRVCQTNDKFMSIN